MLKALVALLLLPCLMGMAVAETTARVHVDGAVRRPGVYRLPVGARVAEAIAAAGGPLAGARLGEVNLAAAIADGARCHVPAAAEAPRGGAPAARQGRKRAARKAPGRAAAPVDLNTASAAELDTLPGVGPSTARRILEVRRRLGRFRALEDLREVPGIGAKRLAKLRARVVIR